MRVTGRRALFEKMQTVGAAPVPPPNPVVQFLGQLELLNGVPLNYLVPDDGLLPDESIRFFQVDPNWIYALIEGAASIGCTSSSAAAFDAAARPALHQASTAAARSVRAGLTAPALLPTAATSGFLLRSAVVSGWPGLEVVAYDAQNNVLPVIRMERVQPTILLFWAEGIIDHVSISEPPEGMHFGVDVLGGKSLRYVTVPADAPQGSSPGSPIQNSSQQIPVRGRNVIQIDPLAAEIKAALQSFQANEDSNGNARPFTAAEFALEMVEGVQSVIFVNSTAGGSK